MFVFRSLRSHVRDAFTPHRVLGYSTKQRVALLILALLLFLAGAFGRYLFIKTTVRDAIREERRSR